MARRSSAPKKFKPNKAQRSGSKRNQAAGKTASPPEPADDIVQQTPSDLPLSFKEGSAAAAQKHETEKASEAGSGIKMLAQESGAQFDIESTTSLADICPLAPMTSVPLATDETTAAKDSAEEPLHFFTTSTEAAPVAPSPPAALPAASPAPAMPAMSSADISAEHQVDITDAADSIEQPSQVPVTSKDPSAVAPTPAAALPATSTAAVPPTSPPGSTSDNKVLDEALCTAEPQREGLISSDASKSPADVAPTLPLTESEEQQLKADFDAHTDCSPVPLPSPTGSSHSTSQAQNEGKEAAEIIEQWPRGLTGWALLLCGRFQAKTPTAIRPLVDVAVAAAVEVLAATTALSAICF
ncbi:hypothetical protein COCOBI_10-1780 [Coccomyxa sp. Obi]|nr:hypothetical protein COCOBI_10-1780 [Coccomyxa sp. Obi]